MEISKEILAYQDALKRDKPFLILEPLTEEDAELVKKLFKPTTMPHTPPIQESSATANDLFTEEQIKYVDSVPDDQLRAHLLHQVRLRDNMEADRNSFEKQLAAKPTPIQLEEGELEDFEHLVAEILVHQTVLSDTKHKSVLTAIIQAHKAAYQQRSSERVFSLKDIEDAFDAGYNLCCKHETNHPADAPNKEQYLLSIK